MRNIENTSPQITHRLITLYANKFDMKEKLSDGKKDRIGVKTRRVKENERKRRKFIKKFKKRNQLDVNLRD